MYNESFIDYVAKVAEAEGIDVNSLTEEDLQELAAEVAAELNERSEGSDDEADEVEEEPKTAGYYVPTVADVSLELSKVAAANGIDLTAVSKEEYEAAFNKLASYMSDPHYHEQMAKVAEWDTAGRLMARAFHDELEKQAKAGKIRQAIWGAKRKIRDFAGGVGKKMDATGEEALRRIGGAGVEKASPALKRTAAVLYKGAPYAVGAGVGAGATAASLKKESALDVFESDAIALTNARLKEAGLSHGEIAFSKLAEDADASYAALVEARSDEILASLGYAV